MQQTCKNDVSGGQAHYHRKHQLHAPSRALVDGFYVLRYNLDTDAMQGTCFDWIGALYRTPDLTVP
jgi:hypothetical protein